jgi:hypothetical protein
MEGWGCSAVVGSRHRCAFSAMPAGVTPGSGVAAAKCCCSRYTHAVVPTARTMSEGRDSSGAARPPISGPRRTTLLLATKPASSRSECTKGGLDLNQRHHVWHQVGYNSTMERQLPWLSILPGSSLLWSRPRICEAVERGDSLLGSVQHPILAAMSRLGVGLQRSYLRVLELGHVAFRRDKHNGDIA